jgi:hypothetical protein
MIQNHPIFLKIIPWLFTKYHLENLEIYPEENYTKDVIRQRIVPEGLAGREKA